MTARRTFWIRRLSPDERIICLAGFGARLVDAYDIQLYALALPALVAHFGVDLIRAGLLGGATAAAAALGGLAAGMLADRRGAVPVLRAALVLVGAATLALSVVGDWPGFAALRLAQGFGYGAELVATTTLATQAVRTRYRARAASAVQSGHALGYLVATFGLAALTAAPGGPAAWRPLFAIGSLTGLYGLMLPRLLGAAGGPPAARPRTPPPRVSCLIAPKHRRDTVATAMIGIGVFGAAQVMFLWLPSLLRAAPGTGGASGTLHLLWTILGALAGPWAYGPLGDRLGRRPAMALFLAAQLVTATLYMGSGGLGLARAGLLVGFVFGFLQGGLATGLPPMLAELYPASLRGRAIGGNAVLVRGAGMFTPVLVGYLAGKVSLGAAMAMVAAGSYAVAFAGLLLVRETKRGGADRPEEGSGN